jgi:tetratricopeptide (TPR) repeat protein
MSRKQDSRRSAAAHTQPRGALAELERMFQKEHYKDAVKQAKLVYKEAATPENHRLLEKAYLRRAEQLHRSGMTTSAIEVAGHLLEFGVTDPTLVDAFAPLLMRLGMAQEAYRIQGKLDSPEAMSRLTVLAADQAVLHPERSRAASPETVQEAGRVREALEALEAGNDESALDLVRDIPRSSPLSEWKLFLRGLAAYYRHQREEAVANWDRLDPERVPYRIARRVKDLDPGSSAGGGGASFDSLEALVFGERIIPGLQELRELIGKQDWTGILRRITPLRLRLRGVDPRLAESLTRALIDPLIHHATDLDYDSGYRLLVQFTRGAEPLSIDPHWNRFWGLVWEGPQGHPSEAIPFWEKYLKDLETIPGLSDEERPLARALVWMHLGELHLDVVEIDEDESDDFDDDDFDDEDEGDDESGRESDLAWSRKQAITSIERSLELAPRHRPAYQLLVEAYEEWGDTEKLETARLRLVEAFPDDLDTLIALASSYSRTKPERALEFVERARKLKPLDDDLQDMAFGIRVTLARSLALEKRWDEGRAQFDEAGRLLTSRQDVYLFLGRRAILETKAGHRELADRYEKEALALLAEPTPLWLLFHIESVRYKLTKAAQKHYEDLLKKDLKKKCASETAGAMASLLYAFLGTATDYPGRDQHVQAVAAYVSRTSRMKFRLEDLEHVCQFLAMLPKQRKLFEKLVRRGLKDHPESPVFQMMGAGIEIEKGPFLMSPVVVRKHLDTALKQAEASSKSEYTRLIPRIKQMASLIGQLTDGPLGFLGGFGGPPSGRSGPSFLDPFINLGDDEYDDDDDEFDDPRPGFPRMLPGPRAGRGKTKPKRKK